MFVVVGSEEEDILCNNLSLANSITNVNNDHSSNQTIVIGTPPKQKLISTTCKFIPSLFSR